MSQSSLIIIVFPTLLLISPRADLFLLFIGQCVIIWFIQDFFKGKKELLYYCSFKQCTLRHMHYIWLEVVCFSGHKSWPFFIIMFWTWLHRGEKCNWGCPAHLCFVVITETQSVAFLQLKIKKKYLGVVVFISCVFVIICLHWWHFWMYHLCKLFNWKGGKSGITSLNRQSSLLLAIILSSEVNRSYVTATPGEKYWLKDRIVLNFINTPSTVTLNPMQLDASHKTWVKAYRERCFSFLRL